LNGTVKRLLIWVVTVGPLLVGWRIVVGNIAPQHETNINLMEMQRDADAGRIASLAVVCGTEVTGVHKDGSTFHVTVPPAFMDSAEVKDLIGKGVQLSFSNGNSNPWLNVFFQLLPLLVMVGLFLVILRRLRRKAPEAGAS
jgi:cell division protease FtsH